jgi:hypothetical protein
MTAPQSASVLLIVSHWLLAAALIKNCVTPVPEADVDPQDRPARHDNVFC